MHRFYFVHVSLLFLFATWPIPILTFRFPTYNLILSAQYFKNIFKLVNLKTTRSNNENKLFLYPVYVNPRYINEYFISNIVLLLFQTFKNIVYDFSKRKEKSSIKIYVIDNNTSRVRLELNKLTSPSIHFQAPSIINSTKIKFAHCRNNASRNCSKMSIPLTCEQNNT